MEHERVVDLRLLLRDLFAPSFDFDAARFVHLLRPRSEFFGQLVRLRVFRFERGRHRHLPAVGARRVPAVPLSANVVNIAEETAFDLVGRCVIQDVVVALVADREVFAELLRGARHFFTLDDRVAHQLFAEDVQAEAHRLNRRFRMQVERQTDDDRLDAEFLRVFEEFFVRAVNFDVFAGFVFGFPTVFFH